MPEPSSFPFSCGLPGHGNHRPRRPPARHARAWPTAVRLRGASRGPFYSHGRRRPTIVRVQARLVREVEVLPWPSHWPVIDRNCDAREARWGATGDEGVVRSASDTRYGRADRRAYDGKAKPGPARSRKPRTLRVGGKAMLGGGEVVGDGRLGRLSGVKHGDLRCVQEGRRAEGPPPGAGVRAPMVARKPGNAGGATGCRKVET
jgi:hypothetical protein